MLFALSHPTTLVTLCCAVLLCAGLKIGKFCVSEPCDPDHLDRQQRQADLEPLTAAVQAFMPHAAGPVLDFAACMFIMTPDGHFVIDAHPKHPQVILCGASPPKHSLQLCTCVGSTSP